jgi:hypothetical protein
MKIFVNNEILYVIFMFNVLLMFDVVMMINAWLLYFYFNVTKNVTDGIKRGFILTCWINRFSFFE